MSTESAGSWLDRYTNKTVPFAFRGQRLAFRLSHGLFSSFDIDDGTRLLLKTLAWRIDFPSVHSILDVGCGVGVLGISLARAATGAAVVLQDRDALAAAFTEANCRENGIAAASVRCSLALEGLGGERFDLVVSNLPAKAGKPVLDHLCRRLTLAVAPGGTAAIVVVTPLAGFIQETLRAAGAEVTFTERTSGHVVYHFAQAAGAAAAPADPLAPYVRAHGRFEHGEASWEMDTVYGLPDFDTLGNAPRLAMAVLPRDRPGDTVCWNPGQGHVPMYRAGGRLVLASHDALELAASARNLAAAGRPAARVVPVPAECLLPEALGVATADLLCAIPHPVPRVKWHADLASAASLVLRPGGLLAAAGSSTEMQRLLDAARGLRLVDSRRHAGFRAVLLAPRPR